MSFSEIQVLPDNLSMGKNLSLAKIQIQILPENLFVGKYLNIESTQVKLLPKNLFVGSGIYLDIDKIQNIVYRENSKDNSKIIFACWVNRIFSIQTVVFFGSLDSFEKWLMKNILMKSL